MPKKVLDTDLKAAETTAAEEIVKDENAETVAPVKKTTRKRTTKKAAEKAAEVSTTEAAEEAPVKKTTRKRTTKKAAEAAATAATAETVAEAAEVKAAEAPAKETAEKAPAKKTTRKRTTKKASEAAATVETASEAAEVKAVEAPAAEVVEKAPAKKTTRKRTTKKAAEAAATTEVPTMEVPAAEAVEKAPAKKTVRKRTTKKSAETAAKASTAETIAVPEKAEAAVAEASAEPEAVAEASVEPEAVAEASAEPEAVAEDNAAEEFYAEPETPRRSIAFIGSECHPFVKTGGLGDVMYALPRTLVNMNCDVRVILPRYACIKQEYQDKMVYRGSFYMDLGETGKQWYVGIMEYIHDGVVYDFIDNQELFGGPKPYTNLVDDIPKYCYFAKAALAALNYMDWIPDVIHCHDWQAGLVPVMLRTLFADTPLARSKSVITIHNLRFQGIYNIPTIKYWTGLPDYVFNKDALKQGYEDANMFKGGLCYADRITTVSATYAQEIQTAEYGENLEDHLQYHAGKLSGIVNGIDYEMWNPWTDPAVAVNYDITNVLDRKKENKRALQEELGLAQDDGKFVIGLISRLTDQKGLDLVNTIIPEVMDGNTQVVVLGTGDAQYEDSFRYYENTYKGSFAACIQYDESRAHRIYAGADALLVPSRFEPCGLTQLNAMHYGTVPIVRETGGLKDTVMPYNMNDNSGNGFTFDRYDAGLLLDAINRAKTFFFTNRWCWDEMVQRDMDKDVSWENSARQYKDLYLELTQW